MALKDVIDTDTVAITVIAADRSTYALYSLIIDRETGTSSKASMIAVSESALAPDFSPSLFNYTLTLAPQVHTFDLQIATVSSYATVSVSGSGSASRIGESWSIQPAENDTLLIDIISEDRSDTSTYSIIVNRTHYTVSVSRNGTGGIVNPLGDSLVAAGESFTVQFSDSGQFRLCSLFVNGVTQVPASVCTLSSVSQSTSILAMFNYVPFFQGTVFDFRSIIGTLFSYMPLVVDNDNDPLSFSLTGTLPPGISFNPVNGSLSGTPTTPGYWGDIQLEVSDGKVSVTRPITIEVGIEGVRLVNSQASGLATGVSWTNAYTTLTQALSEAHQEETVSEIWVAGTTDPTAPQYWYSPDPDPDSSFNLKDGLSLYGGFSGNETSRTERSVSAFPTVLSASTPASVNRVLVKAANSSRLDGFNLTGAKNLVIGAEGAAIVASNAQDVVLWSCKFYDNESTSGSAIHAYNSSVRVVNCEIYENYATSPSGTASAIVAENGSFTIENCLIYKNNNPITTNKAEYVMHNRNSAMTIKSCTFADNDGYVFSTGDCSIFNTILCNLEPVQLVIAAGTGIAGNCLVPGGLNGSLVVKPDGLLETHTITDTFPLFANSQINDYSLLNGSWAADGGLSDSCSPDITSDILGNPRILQERIDIGALESNWTQPHARFTIEPSPDGDTDPESGLSHQVQRHSSIPVTAIPHQGFSFYKWSAVSGQPVIADSLSATTEVTVNGIHDSIRPVFAPNGSLCTLTVLFVENSSITSTHTYSLLSTDTIEVTASGSPEYHFNGWTVSGEEGDVTILDPESLTTRVFLAGPHGTIYAQFIPRIVYVSSYGNDANNGLNWNGPKRTVQAAINLAETMNPTNTFPAQVWIAEGTFYPTFREDPNDIRSAVFRVPNHVHLYGGFGGNEQHPDQRTLMQVDTKTRLMEIESILSGDIDENELLDDGNAYTVVLADSTLLNGVTIRDGNANTSDHWAGGGMYAGNVSISYCRIIFNQANRGGGIFYWGSTIVEVDNCYFMGNTALTFPNAGQGVGGAVSFSGTSISYTGSIFKNNTATGSGGAISMSIESFSSISDCIFQDNSSGTGGAMEIISGSYDVSRCSFTNNNASSNLEGGGAVYALWNSSTFTNCTFDMNTSGVHGGGIYASSANMVLFNCTFSNDTTQSGYGGAVYFTNMQTPLEITNCILWGNRCGTENSTDLFEKQIFVNGAVTPNVTYSCIQSDSDDIYPGVGNSNEDPLFEEGFLHLTLESPLVNRGTPVGAPIDDITGALRDDEPDMGAYEVIQ